LRYGYYHDDKSSPSTIKLIPHVGSRTLTSLESGNKRVTRAISGKKWPVENCSAGLLAPESLERIHAEYPNIFPAPRARISIGPPEIGRFAHKCYVEEMLMVERGELFDLDRRVPPKALSTTRQSLKTSKKNHEDFSAPSVRSCPDQLAFVRLCPWSFLIFGGFLFLIWMAINIYMGEKQVKRSTSTEFILG
jgi:hypothetical protein